MILRPLPVADDLGAWKAYLEEQHPELARKTKGRSDAEWVLSLLDARDPELLQELRQAAERPISKLTPSLAEVTDGKLIFEVASPHLEALTQLQTFLYLRGSAAAHLGNTEVLRENVHLLNRLGEGISDTPTLLHFVVALSYQKLCHQLLREAIASQHIDLECVQTFENSINSFDLQASYLHAIRGEFASILEALEWAHSSGAKNQLRGMNGSGRNTAPGLDLLIWLGPSGWMNQNRSNYVNWILDYTLLPARDGSLDDCVSKALELTEKIHTLKENYWNRPQTHIATALIGQAPLLSRALPLIRDKQNLARAACALERHRLEFGDYPNSLEGFNSSNFQSINYTRDDAHYRMTLQGPEIDAEWHIKKPLHEEE